ncbi:DUF2599 domain-containing protein [Sporosarcina sp. SAFN-015]|uniref:DUF2599 domain-containing protein n=1 Tax=Sporosarcina sp. SAFN-015 TaxID=3387274 RepID=UPI003F81E0C7
MTALKGVRRIAGVWILSAGLVLSIEFSGYIGEVSAEERVKALNKYQKEHVYTQEDVLKALDGYNGDKSKKGLMEYGLKTGDMSLFHAIDAMIRPAFYDVVDGRFEKNKFYYGALIEKHLQSGNQYITNFGHAAGIKHKKKEDKRFWELVEKYKVAPGLIPYVIGFTNTKQNADKYGVEVTPIEFHNSKWNFPDVMTKGSFSNKDKVIAVGELETDEEIGMMDYDDYFEKIEWIDRKGTLSLSIYPKFSVFKKEDGKLDEQHIKHSFYIIESEFGQDEKWNNTDSMRMQYECHVYFARDSKVPWNIEPHRTETRFSETVLKSCNP